MQQIHILVIALTVFWLIDKYLGKKRITKKIQPTKGNSYPKFYFSAKDSWYSWYQLKGNYQQKSKTFYVSPTNYSKTYYTTIS